MNYSTEFKEKVFRVLRFTPFVSKTMKSMEDNNHNKVRLCLEEALDDKDLNLKEELKDDGDIIIHNSKLHTYNDRLEIYSDFMNSYEAYLSELEPYNELVKNG